MSKKNLGKIESVPIREAWSNEASDFTPWLAQEDNLNTLAESLGISELVLEKTEYYVGDFKLDVLCTDGDEKVVIENQLEKTNHDHLGKILVYAAGIGAKKVIWIAESFRQEHVATLQFLNENTTEDLNFFGVEMRVCKIGDSPLAPQFEVVVKPNGWAKAVREQAHTTANSSPTRQLQLRFWTGLSAYLSKNAPKIRPQKPHPQHWFVIAIGRSGFNLNPTVHTRLPRLGVEIWIKCPQGKQHFYNLFEQKEAIESRLGFELDWQELPDSPSCARIVSWKHDAPFQDEHRWDEYFHWMTQRIVKMDEVFRPIVRELP